MYYRKIKGVSSNNLMRMGGRAHSRADERIGALDSELRAAKTEHVLRRDRLPQKHNSGESVPQHGEILCVMCRRECENFIVWKSYWLLISKARLWTNSVIVGLGDLPRS